MFVEGKFMTSVTPSSGNVFADLGLMNPTELKLKSEVIMAVMELMEDHQLSQADVARMTGVDAGALSMALRGKPNRISTGRLIEMYTTLGGIVDIEFTSPESLPAKALAAR